MTDYINEFCMHDATCGELRKSDVGREVTLCGWAWHNRDHGGLIFCDLRDRTGMTQCTFDPEHAQGSAFHTAETMRPEWPILVHGTVIARDNGAGNTATFTVRRISYGVGVEKVFPLNSPYIDRVEVERSARVRRAKLYYLRNLTGKKARLREA